MVAKRFFSDFKYFQESDYNQRLPENSILLSTPTASGIASTGWIHFDYANTELSPSAITLIKDRYVILNTYLNIRERYVGNLTEMTNDWITSPDGSERHMNFALQKAQTAFPSPYNDSYFGRLLIDGLPRTIYDKMDQELKLSKYCAVQVELMWRKQIDPVPPKLVCTPCKLQILAITSHSPLHYRIRSSSSLLVRGPSTSPQRYSTRQYHWKMRLQGAFYDKKVLLQLLQLPSDRAEFVHWCLVDPQYFLSSEDDVEWPGIYYLDQTAEKRKEIKQSNKTFLEILSKISEAEQPMVTEPHTPYYFNISIQHWPRSKATNDTATRQEHWPTYYM